MTRQSKIAILVSIILHILVFIIFTAVKLYNSNVAAKEEMPVMFMKAKNTKPLRRSNPTRQLVSISKLPQNQSLKQAIIQPTFKSSEIFYTDAPERMFSIAGNIEHKGSAIQLVAKPPSIKALQPVISPVSVAILKETQPQETQLEFQIVSGHDFLKDLAPMQFEPDMKDMLGQFSQNVRRKIESRKIYPLAARRSMIEGRVGIKMTIMQDGQLEVTEIIESSGHDILDKAALESIYKASPFPSLPKEINRERIQMKIYLVFKMT